MEFGTVGTLMPTLGVSILLGMPTFQRSTATCCIGLEPYSVRP